MLLKRIVCVCVCVRARASSMSVCPCALQCPLTTALTFLADICFWPGISVVLNAFRHNAGKMGETILLGLLCMYVWMVIGLLSFNSEESTLQEGICVNMFQVRMTLCLSACVVQNVR